MTRRFALALAVVAACARDGGDSNSAWVVVRTTPFTGIDLAKVEWSPRDAAHLLRSRGVSEIELVRTTPGAALHVEIPGACPIDVPPAKSGEQAHVDVAPWIDPGEDRAQVGFGASFRIDVVPGCAAARRGSITWRQTSGPPLDDLTIEDQGFRLHARTRPLGDVFPGPWPWGIVPFSPRTRGEYALEAVWHGEGAEARRSIRLASAARATGVPSVVVGQRLYLGGAGWRFIQPPEGSRATLGPEGPLTSLVPDVGGRWVIEDGEGNRLSFRAGLHDKTSLDCGRAECHASAAHGAESSPMTHVLERALGGALGANHDVTCTLACHSVGEPGLRDGGFVDNAQNRGLSFSLAPAEDAWGLLPRTLRRLGGVGCTSCHGPGAIPEKGARSSILAADVCATCHDAPPRYAHVVAWRASRMARADTDERTRTEAACARCHTTSGFLSSLGVPPKVREPMPKQVPLGIACAACHAPHADHPARALMRDVPFPASLGAPQDSFAASRVCMACHAPVDGEAYPSASAAAVWLGPSADLAPHRAVPGGCVGCHTGTPPANGARGTSHSFAVDRERCKTCHADGRSEDAGRGGKRVRERALALSPARVSTAGMPPHAQGHALSGITRDVALVLEDPAAGFHNAPFARKVLDEAEHGSR